MTSSTPSPSAQELADAIEARIKAGQCVLMHVQQAGWVVAALRRLSETERERDEARRVSVARKTEIERLEQEFMAASGRAAAAEAERDALREMLAAKQIALDEAFAVIERHRQRLAEKDPAK